MNFSFVQFCLSIQSILLALVNCQDLKEIKNLKGLLRARQGLVDVKAKQDGHPQPHQAPEKIGHGNIVNVCKHSYVLSMITQCLDDRFQNQNSYPFNHSKEKLKRSSKAFKLDSIGT